MQRHVYRDALRATATLLLRQLKHAAMSAVLLLRYYYKNYNTMPCLPCYYCSFFYEYYNTLPRSLCYYYTTATTTTTLCHARRATTTLLLRQLQHAAVHTVQILHYYCDNYKTLSCSPCYYNTITTTITTRCGAHCANTTLLLRQLQNAVVPIVLLLQYKLKQLQHALVATVLLLHYYYDNYNALPCPLCYYYTTTTTTTMHRHACRDARPATTTQLVRQLKHAAMLDLLQQHYNKRQLQHAAAPAELEQHYYNDKHNMLPCIRCYYYTSTTTTTTR